jgi:cytochrome c1
MKNKEPLILVIVVFFSLLTYYLVEPFAHSQMHKHFESEGFTYKDLPDLTKKGDATRGKDLVMGAGACTGCHSIEKAGVPASMEPQMAAQSYGVNPPDLSSAGAVYSAKFLANLIKNPAHALMVEHKFDASKGQMHPMVPFYGAGGDIDQEIIVRIDSPVNFVAGNTIEYSYSLDGGQTWDRGHKVIASGSGYEELPIPNGVLKIAPSGVTNSLSGGEQFIIKPRDASIDSEISQDIYLPINHVGTEIFGGYYENSCGYEMAFATNEQKNLFVGIGKLIASLELNDQEGISNSLDYIDSALEQVGQMHADIGARLNRLKTSDSILADLQVNQMERKSFIEDVDFADLLTKISQQQTVYQTILKSASMIMKMSLVNYI